MSREAAFTATTGAVTGQLSFLDRFLAVWILITTTAGLGLDSLMPGLGDALVKVTVTGVPVPIALGAVCQRRTLVGLLGSAQSGVASAGGTPRSP